MPSNLMIDACVKKTIFSSPAVILIIDPKQDKNIGVTFHHQLTMPEIPLEVHQLCLVPDFFKNLYTYFHIDSIFPQVKERLVQPTLLERGKNNLFVKFTLAQGRIKKVTILSIGI